MALKEITDRLGDAFAFDLVCAKLKPGLASRETIGNATVHRIGFGSAISSWDCVPRKRTRDSTPSSRANASSVVRSS
ncbi:hypothetical protein EDM68_03110, partial [Candidatus Uhrbacteria bacterium]